MLNRPAIKDAAGIHGRGVVLRCLRASADALRRLILSEGDLQASLQELFEADTLRLVAETSAPSIVRVINATGILLHTNLGRAPLSIEIVKRAADRAAGYSNLELDLETGRRGSRLTHIQKHFAAVFPGSGCIVVNNNAAAVMLILNTLAAGREVVVSRGELVEIGGSFRIPDICERSGARLVEVGTTNRTRIADYARSIRRETALLMRVHPSNFKVVGFTESADARELAELARRRRIPAVADLGSGTIAELPAEIARDPSPAQYLKWGYSLVCFSGDKLLGACQAGIVLGKARLIDLLKRNPLYRTIRPDKLTLAILEETLIDLQTGGRNIPLLSAIRTPLSEIERRATALAGRIPKTATVELRRGHSLVGGGSATDLTLDTMLICIGSKDVSEAALLTALRRASPPIIARIENRRLVIDLRTVSREDDEVLGATIARAIAS